MGKWRRLLYMNCFIDDRALADAVARYNHLDPVSFANTWEGTLAASTYWDNELLKHCH